jgi:DedD protein
MAFFKFRKNSPSQQDAPRARNETAAPAETVESLRRRALYRLIGAAVLVLIVAIGFPMLFDTQPRHVVAVQAPIIIPDRNTLPPLMLPDAATAPAPRTASQAAAAASPAVKQEAEADAVEERAPAPSVKSGAAAPSSAQDARAKQQAAKQQAAKQQAAKQQAAQQQTAKQQAAQQQTAKQQAAQQQTAKQQAAQLAAEKRKADDLAAKRQREQTAEASRARALLDGKNAAPPASPPSGVASARDDGGRAQEVRYVIQIGSFANEQAAQTARQKAEHAGLRTYSQAVANGPGQHTRVRMGPFANREEATQALAKLKQAGLSGSIMSQ